MLISVFLLFLFKRIWIWRNEQNKDKILDPTDFIPVQTGFNSVWTGFDGMQTGFNGVWAGF